MDESLERFLVEVREGLGALPPQERERRYDAICRELERGVAAELARGRSEEDAVAYAVAQLDLARFSAPTPSPASLRLQLAALPPVAVAVLYCVVAHKVVGAVLNGIFLAVASRIFPQGASVGLGIAPAAVLLAPSLIAAVLGIAAVLTRDGWRSALRNARGADSVIGSGLRWILLSQSLSMVVWLTLLLLVRFALAGHPPNYGMTDGEPSGVLLVLVLVLLPLAAAAPFAAGWLVGKAAPRHAFHGVQVAAGTGFALSVADQFSGVFASPGGSVAASLVLFVVAAVCAALYAGLGIVGAYFGSHVPARRR